MVSVGERFGLTPKPDFEVSELPEGLKVSRKSNFTGRRNEMILGISSDQFLRWRRGEDLIQNIMPDLTPEEREFLMSGSTPEEWAEVFPPEDEEDAA